MENKSQPEEGLKSGEKEVLEKIAGKVMGDSKNQAKLTSIDLLTPFATEGRGVRAYLDGLAGSPDYQDIKSITTATGAVYLYSEPFITRKDAERLVLGEEVRGQIVARVREDSGKSVKLTAVNFLGALIPGAEPDKIDLHLAAFSGDERYSDIKLITSSKNSRYLYSETFMTRTYATVLVRAEANDPVATIAETVRDESRIYPRPTNAELFEAEVFNIDPDKLVSYITELLRREEYKDIKAIRASTGAVYLYSDLYLKEADWVECMVEWEEVGRPDNP